MAKLNRDDHKKNDVEAKIVKWGLIAVGAILAAVVKTKKKDANEQEDDVEDDDLA